MEEAVNNLQRIQEENVMLYEKIANLKRMMKDSGENKDSIVIEDDVYSDPEAQLEQIEAECKVLKKEMQACVLEKRQIQTSIEEKQAHHRNILLPKIKVEEKNTEEFYSKVLSKCKTVSGIEFSSLRDLLNEIQSKRKFVSGLQDEHERLSRIIAFHHNTTSQNTEDTPTQKKVTIVPTFSTNPISSRAVRGRSRRRVSCFCEPKQGDIH